MSVQEAKLFSRVATLSADGRVNRYAFESYASVMPKRWQLYIRDVERGRGRRRVLLAEAGRDKHVGALRDQLPAFVPAVTLGRLVGADDGSLRIESDQRLNDVTEDRREPRGPFCDSPEDVEQRRYAHRVSLLRNAEHAEAGVHAYGDEQPIERAERTHEECSSTTRTRVGYDGIGPRSRRGTVRGQGRSENQNGGLDPTAERPEVCILVTGHDERNVQETGFHVVLTKLCWGPQDATVFKDHAPRGAG